MLDLIRFQWQVRKIYRSIDKLSQEETAAEKKAQQAGANAKELHELGHSFFFERRMLEDELMLTK